MKKYFLDPILVSLHVLHGAKDNAKQQRLEAEFQGRKEYSEPI